MFIFKSVVDTTAGRKNRYVTAPDFKVFPVEETRATGKTIAGVFREVAATGRNRSDVVRIRTTEGALRATGGKGEWGNYVKRSAASVKAVLRKVRPEEEAILAQHDLVIAELEEALKTARLARAEAVADAWQRAHVVRLQDVTEKLS